MSKLTDLLDELVSDSSSEKKVTKTWPMTTEEKKTHDRIVKTAKRLAEEAAKMKNERDRMWADISDRLETYGERLRINAKDGVIEKYEGGLQDLADSSMCSAD